MSRSGAWIRNRPCSSTPACVARLASCLERTKEFRPAVGIARVVDAIDADEDVKGAEGLGPGQGEAEEDGVPRRDVSDRNAVRPSTPPRRSLGTSTSEVRALPPNARRSISSSTWRRDAHAIARRGGRPRSRRHAAGRSERSERGARSRASRASASAVAESRPPLRRMTAGGFAGIDWLVRCGDSTNRLSVPPRVCLIHSQSERIATPCFCCQTARGVVQ